MMALMGGEVEAAKQVNINKLPLGCSALGMRLLLRSERSKRGSSKVTVEDKLINASM